jgi:hypothetical protein
MKRRFSPSICRSACIFYLNLFRSLQADLFQIPRQTLSNPIALCRRQIDLKVAYQLMDDVVYMSTSQFNSVSRPVKAIWLLLVGQSEEAERQGL